MNFYDILLPVPFDKPFTYKSAESIPLFQIVEVSFGSRTLLGLNTGQSVNSDLNTDKIKNVEKILNYQLSHEQFDFIKKMSSYNLIPLGMVLKMHLSAPKAFEEKYQKLPTLECQNPKKITLNNEQLACYNSLKAKLNSGFSVSVLHGITGSGKTEVYLNLVEDLYNQGKQALILLPEILLTSQLTSRFKSRLGHEIIEWHSSLTPKTRAISWNHVRSSSPLVIAGARSALFLPYNNLGLIIIDEEHDSSFKQEEGSCYNARDMAILYAKTNKIPVILSSATPSIETEYNARTGKFDYFSLKSRYGASKLPNIEIIDSSIESEKKSKSQSISNSLRAAIIENFSQGKQSLLFLNRRGYAPITICDSCHNKIQCLNCNFNLVLHKSKNEMLCHYCGYKTSQGVECGNCGSKDKFFSVGVGVEKLKEEVLSFLPDSRVEILSSDMITSKSRVDEILSRIIDHEVDILIGTQMVTKGLHFPKLDLVGVLDADAGFLSGDIRALEHTYQMIHQVSGRAGRESESGKVILQTAGHNHTFCELIKTDSWHDFVTLELENRKQANMPPFSRISIIHLSSKNEVELIKFVKELSRNAPSNDEIRVLGPSPAPIYLLKRSYRYRFIVISEKMINFQKLIKMWVDSCSKPKTVDLKIDIDPISFT